MRFTCAYDFVRLALPGLQISVFISGSGFSRVFVHRHLSQMSDIDDREDVFSGEGDDESVGYFKSCTGHKLACKYWNPIISSTSPRCLVFISHGVAEHSLWYDDVAQKLVEEGCKVFAHDHVGHGRSEGDRVQIADFSMYCDDVIAHVMKVKEVNKDIPCFIIGHSMGGAIAIMSALRHPELFKGVVLISPAIRVDRKSAGPFKIFLSKVAGKILPNLPVASVSPDWVSRDAEVCKRYIEDPLVWHGSLKAGWANCMLGAMSSVEENLENIKFPFLILHGSDDQICELQGSTQMHEKSPSLDKTLKVYEGAYHQVHHEPEGTGTAAIKDITDWIVSRSVPSGTAF